jgi:asparagine synthase (glutamine-hydrolysing)
MCGIAGVIAKDIGQIPGSAIQTMRASILYRGRDAQDEWNNGEDVHLFHARLSIIDLTTGNQPMWDASGRYVIVYNGEIYNYKELRIEYARLGGRFNTQSDTEVILEGFKLKGERVCRDLNGMFAFAIWDTQTRRLFLARDHLGKKPLVWCEIGGAFYFASTLDAFRSIPGWTGKLSVASVELYRLIGGFPLDLTVYEQARALPPASFAWVNPENPIPQVDHYWQMDFRKKSHRSLSHLLEEYEALLTDAIAIRLRSDVPLALTFSGGVDSGTIAALCAQRLNVSLDCYTIDYHTEDDPSLETVIAERVAHDLGLPWQHIQFNYHEDLLGDLPRTYSFYDQPCVQLALVYSHRLYEIIRPYAKVVLSGNGSDEIFTGYIGDEAARKDDLERLKGLPFLHRYFGIKDPSDSLATAWGNYIYSTLKTRLSPYELNTFAGEMVMSTVGRMVDCVSDVGVDGFLDRNMYLNLLSSTSDSNYRLPDISGLAAQVEVRSPFLDYRMVEFAAHVPHQFKIGNPNSPDKNKYLPKVFYERLLGKEIAWARKKGMGFNLRWHHSIVDDNEFHKSFEYAYTMLDRAGINSQNFRNAWEKYIADMNNDIEYPLSASEMMAGFMFGFWLSRENHAEGFFINE